MLLKVFNNSASRLHYIVNHAIMLFKHSKQRGIRSHSILLAPFREKLLVRYLGRVEDVEGLYQYFGGRLSNLNFE